jgi:hypothetical protein
MGRGEIIGEEEESAGRVHTPSDSKVQTLPARSFHCAQSCLVIAIAVAIILFAIGCFGLWAIADYLMLNVFNLPYRAPLTEIVPPGLLIPLSHLAMFL